jgi:hypothetical protein
MNNKIILLIGVIVIVIVGVVLFDYSFAVKPEWPPVREGEPIPARPLPADPVFRRSPLALSFEGRRAAFLEWIYQQETPEGRAGVWTDIAKLEFNPDHQISPTALQESLDFVNAHNDTADFHMAGLLRLYYKYAGSNALTPQQVSALEETFKNHKYWLDEPNPTPMELWTENHQILTYSSEYLAGQLFPEAIFSNNQETGEWHRQIASQRINRWIDWRARTGMAEWDAVIYYRMDLAALLNLVDFAQDEQISTKAAMMVDYLLFDIITDSYYGLYNSAHGRATAASIKSQAGQSIQTLIALVWGLSRFQSADEMASISLATSPRYQLPGVIEAIGSDNPQEYTNLERQSIPVTDEAAAEYGLSFEAIDDIDIWWGMGAFTHPKVIDLTVATANEWDLWHYPDFRPLKDVAMILDQLNMLGLASKLLKPDTNGTVTDEVNKITYRTPDYILSSAQDYRKGDKGYQQHIWQAALDPYAVVFVTNPDSLKEDDGDRPSYWSSQGRLPRTGQVRNVLIALYDIDRYPSPSIFEARHYAFTHAYFPIWAFDEVVVANGDQGGWIFGRKGQGYIALYSHQRFDRQTQGPDADQEYIALGRHNVWIVQMGREVEDGPFEDFVFSITAAPLRISGLDVEFESPGNGLITFGWDQPLILEGEPITLRDYPRWDNPYTQSEFGQANYLIEYQNKKLQLDFENALRVIVD